MASEIHRQAPWGEAGEGSDGRGRRTRLGVDARTGVLCLAGAVPSLRSRRRPASPRPEGGGGVGQWGERRQREAR